MSYLAWCYCEFKNDKDQYYYAYSTEMSAAEFAFKVSEKVGYTVVPGETIGIHREKELIEFHAEHI